MNYRRTLEEEASKNGVRVYYHKRGAQWGRAGLRTKRIFVPTPHRFPSFFTGLHELGHILSNHHAGDGKPEYLWEYEAFNWALQFCKNRGIHVPEKTITNERNIIAEKVRKEVDRGARRLDPECVGFIKQASNDDPDVAFVKKFIGRDGRVSEGKGLVED